MDSFEKQVTSSLLGENYSNAATDVKPATGMQVPTMEQMSLNNELMDLSSATKKLEGNKAGQRNVLSQNEYDTVQKYAKKHNIDVSQGLTKATGVFQGLLNLRKGTTTAPVVAPAPPAKNNDIIGIKPVYFWSGVGVLGLLTVVLIARR